MLTRVIDFLKTRGITALFTSLATSDDSLEKTETLISSLMDTWILTSVDQEGIRRSRYIYVLKSRGMPHSDEVHSFRFTDRGIVIQPVHAVPARESSATAPKRKQRGKRAARGGK